MRSFVFSASICSKFRRIWSGMPGFVTRTAMIWEPTTRAHASQLKPTRSHLNARRPHVAITLQSLQPRTCFVRHRTTALTTARHLP